MLVRSRAGGTPTRCSCKKAGEAGQSNSVLSSHRRPEASEPRPRLLRCARKARGVSAALALLVLSCTPWVAAIPHPPQNLRVPFVTRFEVAVAWEPPSFTNSSNAATMYKLEYREQGSDNAWTSYGPGAIFEENTLRLGSLRENTAYDVRVFAGNSDGWSDAAELTDQDEVRTTNPPDPPENVRAAAFTETSLSLTWDDAQGPSATHWRVKVSECEKKVWQVACNFTEGLRPCLADRTVRCTDYAFYQDQESGVVKEFTSRPAIVQGLKQGYNYFVIVEGRNLNINGYDYGGSLPVRVTPRGAFDSAPSNVRVMGVESGRVRLQWEAAAGATHYRVQYRRPAVSETWQPTSAERKAQHITTGTEFVVKELTQNEIYQFRVLARDLFEETTGEEDVKWAGEEQGDDEKDQFASNIVSATPVSPLQGTPSGLSVVGVRETEVHLTWNALEAAVYYVLQYKRLDEAYEQLEFWKDFEANPGEVLRITTTSGVVTELTTGRRYEFRVKAFNAHVATETYLGYAGPSASVFAMPLERLAPSEDFTLISGPWLDMLQCALNTCAIQSSDLDSVQLSANAPATDDILVGARIRLTSGAAIHEDARILSYNGTSKVATLARPLSAIPSTGDTYEVSRFSVGEDRAIVTWTRMIGATRYKISIRRTGAHERYTTRAVLLEPQAQTAACTRTLGNASHPSLRNLSTRCYELTGLKQGVTYDVILSAGNMHLDWGLASVAVQLRPDSVPSQIPGKPAVLAQTTDSVTLKWTNPVMSTTPTSMYRVIARQVTDNNSAPWSAPIDYPLLTDQDEGFRITGLERGFPYDFEIVPGNLAGFRYPALGFRLVTPCTNVRIDGVRSVADCVNYPSYPQCKSMSVKLSWTAPKYGYYFKVLARKRGSSAPYVGLPTVARTPYETKATVLNVTTFAFDNMHYPELEDFVEFEYKVVSSFGDNGPFEDIGSVAVVAMANAPPSPVNTLRLKSKTLHSITVNWNHSVSGPSDPKPYFFVGRLCPATVTIVDIPSKTAVIAFEDKTDTANLSTGIDDKNTSTTVVLSAPMPNLDIGEYIKRENDEYMKVISINGLNLTVERAGSPPGLVADGIAAISEGSVVTLAEGGLDDQGDSDAVKLVDAIPSLDVGEYIKSASGEYMKVIDLTESGKTLIVERNAAPAGLNQGSIAAAAAGSVVILAEGAFTDVHTQTAAIAVGGGLDDTGTIGVLKLQLAIQDLDNGEFIKSTSGEYMKVINMTDGDKTLTVERNAAPSGLAQGSLAVAPENSTVVLAERAFSEVPTQSAIIAFEDKQSFSAEIDTGVDGQNHSRTLILKSGIGRLDVGEYIKSVSGEYMKVTAMAYMDRTNRTTVISQNGGVSSSNSSTLMILDNVLPDLDVGEYIKSTAGEYMKVTAISGNGLELTVIRNLAPAGLSQGMLANASGGENLTLVEGLNLTVERNAAPPGLTQGSLQKADPGESVLLVEGGVNDQSSSATIKLVTAIAGLDTGEYIKSESGEYMKVTHKTDSGRTLTVLRGAAPAGLVQGSIAAAGAGTTVILAEPAFVDVSSQNATITFEDVPGQKANVAIGAGIDDQTNSVTLKIDSVIANLNVGEYIKRANIEYMRVVSIAADGITLTVERNSAPPGLQQGSLAAVSAGKSFTLAEGGLASNVNSTLLKLAAGIENLKVGDYLKSASGEYMKVLNTADQSTSLTVARNVLAPGLIQGSLAAADAGTVVTLAEEVFADNTAETATISSEGGVTDHSSNNTIKLDTAIAGLDTGEYIKSESGEYMKVTHKTDSGRTLTVLRGAAPAGLVQGSIAAAGAGTTVILVERGSSAGKCSRMSVYPDQADLSQATRFYAHEASLDLFRGLRLSTNLPYNISIYACNYFDANGDGVLTGDEGCNTNGVQLPYPVSPGGLAPPVTTVKVVETSSNILKLEWQRPGALGNSATMYSIMQRQMGALTWTIAKRVLVRGTYGSCPISADSPCPRCADGEHDDLDNCLKATGVTYGNSEGADTCGMDHCVENFGGGEIYISEGMGKGEVRTLKNTVEGADGFDTENAGNVFTTMAPLFGALVSDAYQSTFSAIYNVYRQDMLGGLCCPVTSQTVEAYVADLKPDTAYQFQVFAGNMNEQQFETVGSEVATGFTISTPNEVTDLSFVYLVGANATRLQWSDPGGPKFCGERVYQILARLTDSDPWELLNTTSRYHPWIKHTSYFNGVGKVELNVVGLPWARTASSGVYYAPAELRNDFMIRTYCSNHLGFSAGQTSIPGMTYLDDIAFSRVDGNIINVLLRPPPMAHVEGLEVLYITEDSAFLRWDGLPRAEFYKVLFSYDSKETAGPWIGSFNAFSTWEDSKNVHNETQIFRNPNAKVTGLFPEKRYRFKIVAGSRHEHPLGSFSSESLPSDKAYHTALAPHSSDLELELHKITESSITVRFSVSLQASVDPANHSQNILSLLLKKGDGAFEGGLNTSGCTTEVITDDTYIGAAPGCEDFTVLNYTAVGRTYYEYTFLGLVEGVKHSVMVKTFNLNSPNRRAIVLSVKATSCICAQYGSNGACIQYRIFGSSTACTPDEFSVWLQPPASENDHAYDTLFAFVRRGTGAGQRRRITMYHGSERRIDADTKWDIPLDETSVVEIHESGLAADGNIAQGCNSGSSCAFLTLDSANTSAVWEQYKDHYIELFNGNCEKQLRRIVGYDGDARQVAVYPPFTCNPGALNQFAIRPFSFATKSIGPIAQVGPPIEPEIPVATRIRHNSVQLAWPPVTLCMKKLGGAQLPCAIEVYRIRKKKTHDSSDFPIINGSWSTDYFFTTTAGTMFEGLEDMCSFEVQIAAKTAYNDEWGHWSPSQFFKLTGGAPSLQPSLLPFVAGEYNDRILVKWTTDLNPKQIDRFYFSYGESQSNMRDFTEVVQGIEQRKVFLDNEVCVVDEQSSTKTKCEAFLTGLQMGTIYFVKVFGGNMNGFEEIGTTTGTQATLRLPMSAVTSFSMDGVIMSGNVTGYKVRLSWNRPQGYPAVSRYYLSSQENFQGWARLAPDILTTDRVVNHVVGDLNKGSTYQFRVHSGNDDGPTGFHLDMNSDPTVSEIITVVPDGVPGRAQITSGIPVVPDMNSMAELQWNVPNAGAEASYYTLGTKLTYTLDGCQVCVTENAAGDTLEPEAQNGFCLANSDEAPLPNEDLGTVRYRRCDYNPPCDATCAADVAIQLVKGCTSTDPGCALNLGCNPVNTLCLQPCMGASNEGPSSAGQPCIFNTTRGMITGLERDAWYEFYVFAGNTAGTGLASDPLWMKTEALPKPVTGLNVSQVDVDRVRLVWNQMDPSLCTGGQNGNCTYKVTWDPPTKDAQGNTLSMAYVPRKVGEDGKVYYPNLFDHEVDFSQGSIRYVYRVYAGDDLTNLYEQFGTEITLPAGATEFKVISATQNSLTFSWIPDPAANKYQILMSAGLAYRAASAETGTTQMRVEGLAQDLEYNFKVVSKVMGRTPFEYSGSNVYRAVPTGLSSAPQNLQVVSTSQSSVLLSWESGDAKPAVRYKVLRSVDGSPYMAYPQDIEMLRGGSHEALITDLSDMAQYKFKVYAGNFNGYENVGSNEVRNVQPVGRARQLSIRGVSDTSVTIDWLPPEYGRSPSHYQLQYTIGDVQTRIADVQHLGGSRATQSALLTPLLKDKYSLRIFCKSQSGYYEPSGTGDVLAVPLVVPYGLRVILTTFDTITLAWKIPPYTGSGFKPVSFRIEYVMVSDGTTGKVENIGVYENMTAITGLITNRPYQFSIKAEFEDDEYFGTLASNLVEATPLDQASNVAIAGVSSTTVSLAWLAPAKGVLPIAYRVRYIDMETGVSQDVDNVQHAGSFKTSQTYTVTGLTNGRQYGFLVLAQAGTGAYSNNEVEPVKTTPLALPENLKVTSVTETSAFVVWTPPLPQAGAVNPLNYQLHYADKVAIIPFGNSQYLVQDLNGSVEYEFCLYVRSPAGDVIPGNRGVDTDLDYNYACASATPMNQVTNLRVVDIRDTSISVEWDALTPIMSSDAKYVAVAVPVMRAISALTGRIIFRPISARMPLSQVVNHASNLSHHANFSDLNSADIFSIQIYVQQGKYTEPVGSNSVVVSAVGRARNTRLCYYDKTEFSLQWNAPDNGPTPSSYRISYRQEGCTAEWWQTCATEGTTTSITHKGNASSTQIHTLFGLSERMIYDVRVHTYNDQTQLFDPVGSIPIIVQPRGDRSDFALSLPHASNGYAEVSRAADYFARKHFETKSVTLEAWIKLDPVAAENVGYQGIAGNLYSFTAQSADSQGAGHFGYGLFCETKENELELGTYKPYCGIQIGTMTEPGISLQGLCTSLNFENAEFCGGIPGFTNWHRAESKEPIPAGIWTHLAGSYDHLSGRYTLIINGELSANRFVSGNNPGVTEQQIRTLTYAPNSNPPNVDPPEIYYSGNDGAYPVSVLFPRNRMDWNIGRLLIGEVAPTVATAPYAYFAGQIDEVRVWSYGKTVQQMRDTAFLDTVSPESAGLLGYWPFDDPVFAHKCADEVRIARDAMTGAGHQSSLQGTSSFVLSTVPLDRVCKFSPDTPANNSELIVHLGDTIHLRAEAFDENPSDQTYVVLEVPSDRYSHPSGATFSDVSQLGASFSWAPLPRDAGKAVSLCFALTNVVTNPLRPDFFLAQGKLRRCITVRVPLCLYKAQPSDTVRSIAQKFQTNWRTVFMLNPEIGHPNNVAAGLVVRIGSVYTVRAQDNVTHLASQTRVTWSALANNNAAIVNRLWTDEYFMNAGTESGRESVLEAFDPGEGVFDIFYQDLGMHKNYTGQHLCLVAQLNTNCI